MADYTVNIDLSDHKRGDKWVGIAQIGPVTINGSQPTNSLDRVVMNFEKNNRTFSLDSDDSEISIDNATTWQARIPETATFLPTAGDWNWDMAFYANGETSPLTLYKGTLTVNDDVRA